MKLINILVLAGRIGHLSRKYHAKIYGKLNLDTDEGCTSQIFSTCEGISFVTTEDRSSETVHHFLRRCLQHRIVPSFIKKKKLHEVCGLPADSKQLQDIELRVLRTALRSKRNQVFSQMISCVSKEMCCQRYLPSCQWKRIVGESKIICDSIRSKTKVRLQNKFTRLVDLERCRSSQSQGRTTLTSADRPLSDNSGAAVSTASRVTVIGGINLSDNARSVLELGPSFSPSQSISHGVSRKFVTTLQTLQDRLRLKEKLREKGQQSVTQAEFPAIPFPSLFFRPQDPNPVVDIRFRLFATSVFTILSKNGQKHVSNLTTEQKRGLRELRDLSCTDRIKISVSDKGGEFVVLPQELDIAITRAHLQDDTLYRTSSADEFRKQYRRLYRVWSDIARTANLPKTAGTRLKCDLSTCPVLYVLLKTHKLSPEALSSMNPADFKVRPIISSIGGPTDRISWLLNLILVQLLPFIPAHLSNTAKFLDLLRETRFRRNHVMESFDVTSLYTNVSKDNALQATFELLNEHGPSINMHGLSVTQVMTLIKECLDCSIFRWHGNYYKQIRGLAMGQRLAPALAIAYMSKIEKPLLDRRPVLYCRYIDDCFVVCSTQKEMDTCFNLLNSQAENIQFTREKPKEHWLPFLNLQVQLDRGCYRTKWYRKPSSKNILVHFRSAHPSKTKWTVVRNMFGTAKRMSSGAQEKAESLKLARKITLSNGYPLKNRALSGPPKSKHYKPVSEESEKVPFCVTDAISSAVRNALRRCGLDDAVRVVEIPPTSLKQQLIRNRMYDRACCTPDCVVCPNGRVGDCNESGVIYLISCKLCGDEYIGETGRPQCSRVKEHLDGLRRSKPETPLGAHRLQYHEDVEFDVAVRILSRESRTPARKTLEAFWISAQSPKMNRKEECLAITYELASFLTLCGLKTPSASCRWVGSSKPPTESE